jgi:serine/threonine protein kinase/Tol biopolymer transport system component
MALAAGARLGPYEILSALGAGGMGEVYRARDTKLGRDVALKILPESFTHDPERLARFRREAQVLAALNHPHIGAIYGLDDANGQQFLVLELVDGETLADRLKRGALPLDEALAIAKQIAEALEAAHEKGIIHRDLKPANIALTKDGHVKVLDFGLAKATEASGASADLANSPTMTSPAMTTGVGVILGTAAYMSPEQAKGRPADKRSDVWAFGCVLYEMLTGKRAFQGQDVSDTLASVLRGEPEWAALPPEVTQSVRAIVRHCLHKDRLQRLADISIALFLMKQPSDVWDVPSQPRGTRQPALWKRAIPAIVASLVVGGFVGIVVWSMRPIASAPNVTRFAFILPEDERFTNATRQSIALSPDGSQFVYVAGNQLHMRSMSELEARQIPGTAISQGVDNPVFSPDGKSIVFYSPGEKALKRIALGGGTAVTICPADDPLGMSWSTNGIVYGQGAKGILRVSATGGKPALLASVNSGEIAFGPQMLPDGETLLFTVGTSSRASASEEARIVVQSLKTGTRRTLIQEGSDGHYLPTGHIVYAVGAALFAVPIDSRRLEARGEPVGVVEGVRRAGFGAVSTTAQFSVSNTGSLIYLRDASTAGAQLTLAVADLQGGGTETLNAPPGSYESVRLSPEGKRLALGTDDGHEAIVWIYDLSGTSSRRRLTFGGRNRFPIWSADGARVAFQSDREGDRAIFWQRADGSLAERLTKPDPGTFHVPESWSPDGTTLLFDVAKGPAFFLWRMSARDTKTTAFDGITSRFPTAAAFSPDGRWVAYAASETSVASSIFVQPYPETAVKYQISGGVHPFWSPNGNELFFDSFNQMKVVRVTTQPSFVFGNVLDLPRTRFALAAPQRVRNTDIAPDGKHIIGPIDSLRPRAEAAATQQIQVVVNWSEELKARVPTK